LKKIAESVSEYIESNPTASILVEWHTSRTWSNLDALSLERAETFKNYLVNTMWLDWNLIQTVWKGWNEPLYGKIITKREEKTDKRNQRIEVYALDEEWNMVNLIREDDEKTNEITKKIEIGEKLKLDDITYTYIQFSEENVYKFIDSSWNEYTWEYEITSIWRTLRNTDESWKTVYLRGKRVWSSENDSKKWWDRIEDDGIEYESWYEYADWTKYTWKVYEKWSRWTQILKKPNWEDLQYLWYDVIYTADRSQFKLEEWSQASINKLTNYMLRFPWVTIRIDWHTSFWKGPSKDIWPWIERAVLEKTEKQAELLKEKLVSAWIDWTRIKTVGHWDADWYESDGSKKWVRNVITILSYDFDKNK